MKDATVSSRRFGEALAAALGNGPGRVSLAAQRVAILNRADELTRQKPFLRRAWVWSLPAVAAVVALAIFVSLRPSGRAQAELEARFAGVPVSEAKEFRAHRAGAQALDFSDGSQVMLAPESRAVVSGISAQRAELRLNQGRLVATIRKTTGVTWTIHVGPYAVRVVGTQFSVDWDQASNRLAVDVREGRVRVFGGDLPEPGVSLDAGGHFQRYAQNAAASAPVEDAVKQVEDSPRSEPRPQSSRPRAEPSASSAAAASSLGFLDLASKGRYQDALAAAEKQGFEGLASSLPENDLVTLANVARFSGNSQRARLALLELRRRFAGRPAAELAALYLARVAEDIEKRPAEAVRWLRTFVQESPSGDLAEGARTNLMSILLRTGDADGARSVAQDYLRYHPRGPHASQARSLMLSSRPPE
jgi:hypothetical protein